MLWVTFINKDMKGYIYSFRSYYISDKYLSTVLLTFQLFVIYVVCNVQIF